MRQANRGNGEMATTAKGIAQQEKLNDISIRLQELKAANEQLKELK